MKTAIVDLGTNTCNLLIAEFNAKNFHILHQSKQLVQLGDRKIRNNRISIEGIERVLEVLANQQKIMTSEGVEKVQLVATSAIREAKNQEEFMKAVSKKMNFPVNVITGEKEAELIFKGVLLAMDEINYKSVILDIGGGSNELILAHKKRMLWKESQPTGMARIVNQFVLSDPIKPREIQILQNFFLARHQAAFQQCKKRAVNTLIGCSGSFDTIADIIEQVNPDEKKRKYQEIPIDRFYNIYNLLIGSTRKQRLSMKGMDLVRVDLIVPAAVFIDHLIKQAGISKIIQTGFSLREGVLYEMMESEAANLL